MELPSPHSMPGLECLSVEVSSPLQGRAHDRSEHPPCRLVTCKDILCRAPKPSHRIQLRQDCFVEHAVVQKLFGNGIVEFTFCRESKIAGPTGDQYFSVCQ